jgi:hypothetical protein
MHTGPNIERDGLVFGYDTGYPLVSGNSDTYKFNKGEPTVNFITELGDPAQEIARGEFGQYFNLVPVFETHGLVPYTLSMEMKGNIPGQCLVYMQNSSYTKYGFVGTWVTLTTEWQRFVFPNLTPTGPNANWQANTPNDNRAMLATYTTYGSGRNPTIKNIQLEHGPHSTPFINGTRSATQGLLPLIGNSTIDLSNVSFDSNAQMTFDGTDDRVTYTTPHDDSVTELTYELVFKGSRGAEYTYILHNNGQDTTTGNSFCTFGWYSSTNYIYGSFNGYYDSMYDTTTTVDSNKYYHLALVWNGATQKFYINGVEKKSMNLGSIVKTLSTTTSVGGEKNAAHRMMNGVVPLVKTYTRALSAQEVQQNYRAYKNRFDL